MFMLSLSLSLSLSLCDNVYLCRVMKSKRNVLGSATLYVVKIDHEIIATVILPFPWFKKSSCQFLAKECAQYRLTA